MGDPLRTYIDALRLLSRTHDANRVVLIERNIDRYLKMESGGKATARAEGEDWSVAREYVRSLLRRMI